MVCRTCRGIRYDVEIVCPACRGTGYGDVSEERPFAQCHTCYGDGTIDVEECPDCYGDDDYSYDDAPYDNDEIIDDGELPVLHRLIERGFEVRFISHAAAILEQDFPDALSELEESLLELEIPITEIIGSGGGEAKATQRLRRSLAAKHWIKTNFEIKKVINGIEKESISHEVDHVRTFDNGVIALEIEWNNKDPFFDRDLENFKRLHAEGAISAGVIVTRGSSLQSNLRDLVSRFTDERGISSFADLEGIGLDPTRRQRAAVQKQVERAKNPIPFAEAWTNHFVSDKFGAATTHWKKLDDRVNRGVGNPCPLLLIGLPDSIVTFDPQALIEQLEEGDDI